jgi:hypothetical protein
MAVRGASGVTAAVIAEGLCRFAGVRSDGCGAISGYRRRSRARPAIRSRIAI